MSWLSKQLHSVAKVVKKAAPAVLRTVVSATPIGAVVQKAETVAKALGITRHAAKPLSVQPISVQAAIAKTNPSAAGKLTAGPLGLVRGRKARKPRARKASKSPAKAKALVKKGQTKAAARKPPSGGLDLKAMASAWKSAGKPSSWRDWIRSNPIRKSA